MNKKFTFNKANIVYTALIASVVLFLTMASLCIFNFIKVEKQNEKITEITVKTLANDINHIFNEAEDQFVIFKFNNNQQKALDSIMEIASNKILSNNDLAFAIDINQNLLFFCSQNQELQESFENQNLFESIFVDVQDKKQHANINPFYFNVNDNKYFALCVFNSNWNCFFVRGTKIDENSFSDSLEFDLELKNKNNENLQKILNNSLKNVYDLQTSYENKIAQLEEEILLTQLQGEETLNQKIQELTKENKAKQDELIAFYDPIFDDPRATSLVSELTKTKAPTASRSLQGAALQSRTDLTSTEKEVVNKMQQTLKSFDYIASFITEMPQKKSLVPYVNALITSAHQISSYAESIVENDAEKNLLLKQAEKTAQSKENKIDSLEKSLEKATTQNRTISNKVDSLTEELRTTENQLSVVNSSLQNARRTAETANKKANETTTKLNKALNDIKTKDRQISTLNKTNTELQSNIKKLNTSLSTAEKEARNANAEVTKIQNSLKTANNTIEKTKTELEENKNAKEILEKYFTKIAENTKDIGFVCGTEKSGELTLYILPKYKNSVDGKNVQILNNSTNEVLGFVTIKKVNNEFVGTYEEVFGAKPYDRIQFSQ